MIYPTFLKMGDVIGVVAPSSGVGKKIEHFERALATLKRAGFAIKETASVRNNDTPSASITLRKKELEAIFLDQDVRGVIVASGGDFCMEILPHLAFSTLSNNPKWLMGMSDPTSLLFILPTLYDIATLYGFNVGGFDNTQMSEPYQVALNYLKGNIDKQFSYPEYLVGIGSDNLPRADVKWLTPNGDVDVCGRLIGGCIDVLRDLIGTPFDQVNKFLNKYKDDGFIWFFDNYALKSEDLYHVCWQAKQAGWFKYCKAIILGRTLFAGSFMDLTYEQALVRLFGSDTALIVDADIGHTCPSFTLINGAYAHVQSKNGKGEISFILK